MNVYAAQHAYYARTTKFATHVGDLKEWLDRELMDDVVSRVQLETHGSEPQQQQTFQATVYGINGTYQATIRDDRYLQVLPVVDITTTMQSSNLA